MKQQNRWRRWLGRRTERVEITHESRTRILVNAAIGFEVVRCPECGSDVTLISPAALSHTRDADDLSVHARHSLEAAEHTKGDLAGGQSK